MAVEAKSSSPRDVKSIRRELSSENAADNPVVEALRRQSANAFVLYANYKHYHWQTFGPHFRDLHLMFDEFAHEVLESIDDLSERIRMIGQDPPARLDHVLELASVSSTSVAPDATMREMIEEANRNALLVIKEIRDGVGAAEDQGDPGTVDLLSKLVQVHEKQEWWLRDILRRDDGFQAVNR